MDFSTIAAINDDKTINVLLYLAISNNTYKFIEFLSNILINYLLIQPIKWPKLYTTFLLYILEPNYI